MEEPWKTLKHIKKPLSLKQYLAHAHRDANGTESPEIDPLLPYEGDVSQTTEAKTALLINRTATNGQLLEKDKIRSMPQTIQKNKLHMHQRSKCKIWNSASTRRDYRWIPL